MRCIVQRVSSALVSINGKVVGEIGKGLFVLVGIKEGDTEKDAEFLAEKLVKLRVMSDKEGKMNLTVSDVDSEILVVSQFTLYADTSGGYRPSFIEVARPDVSQTLYEHFVNQLKSQGVKVQTGKFGEYMEIDVILDGPVTIILES
mgnify:CR=1 FL=1